MAYPGPIGKFTIVTAATLALLGASPVQARPSTRTPRPSPPRLHGNAGRAQDAYQTMQRVFYLPSARLYRGVPYSYLWPFSQALTATVSMAGVPRASPAYRRDVGARLTGLDFYWAAARRPPTYEGAVTPPLGRGGHTYYDDNEWVGLELLRLYGSDHNTAHVTRARAIFDAVTAAWSVDATYGCPGGVPFSDDRRNDQRNVVTTAPGAELGVRLFQVTRDRSTLDWAERMYGWVRGCLALTGGLYADHVDPRGKVDATMWSYNQGTMVGAGVLLYEATGLTGYLAQAKGTARAALAAFPLRVLQREPAFFVSVFFRNLLLLNSLRHAGEDVNAAQAYVNWAWQKVRQRSSGLYTFGPNGTVQLLDQAAMVNLYAYLASPASTLF